ncbi:MAG TPA: type IV pilus secretin PilQ, partial [Gammaproteobacteria bacterium]|nr:type IV pilus secretin PilQ [Gammaproteobacteria bacterium]
LADNSLLDVKLAALENAGHGELISSPSLFTANQQLASIEAGEEIPYQEASSSGATTVVFKKAVLSLKVRPQLLPGKKILLQLHINQDRPNTRLVLGVPTISTRQLLTNVLIPNGQTVVLGGIYEINKEKSKETFPFLAKLPLVGSFFQLNKQRHNKRELLIFVTPRVIE